MLLKCDYLYEHLAWVQIHQLWSWTGKVKTQTSLLIMQRKLPPSVFTINSPLLPGRNNFPSLSCFFFFPGLPSRCIDQRLKEVLI